MTENDKTCVELLTEQDFEYNRKTNAIIIRHSQQLAKVQEFKTYVHQRLDAMGVPHSVPESEHDKAGCRVGGRLDWVEARIKELEDELAVLKQGSSAPVAWIDRKYPGLVGWHISLVPKDGTKLYTAPQPCTVPEWHPIETAPKDGRILGCTYHPELRHLYAPKMIVWAAYHPNATGKECWRDSEICGNKMENVTHWMPLPATPKPEDGEKK